MARNRMVSAIRARDDSRIVAILSASRARAEAFDSAGEIPAGYASVDALLANDAWMLSMWSAPTINNARHVIAAA
jgi:predicted dehydrogenase